MQTKIETSIQQLQLFKPGTACAWCQKEAEQAGVSLGYDPGQVSHGICERHRANLLESVEAAKALTPALSQRERGQEL
jgi:hypothetical protein